MKSYQLVLLLLLNLVISGCGQFGPLYLPPKEQQAVHAEPEPKPLPKQEQEQELKPEQEPEITR
jgi:predicted small lipoprotein YifL